MHITADPDMVQSNGADKRYPMSAKKQEEADAAPKAVSKILAAHLGGNESKYLEILSAKETRHAEIRGAKRPPGKQRTLGHYWSQRQSFQKYSAG